MQQLELSNQRRDARLLAAAQRRPVLHEYDNGLTQIYYGGWASPYTDNYDDRSALHDQHDARYGRPASPERR